MLSLQGDVKELTIDREEVVEKHAHELAQLETQLSNFRHKTSELQGMVCSIVSQSVWGFRI